MAINDLDSDIGPLLPQDFENDADDIATYVMLSAELNRVGKHTVAPTRSRLHELLIRYQPPFSSTATARQQDYASQKNVRYSKRRRMTSAQT